MGRCKITTKNYSGKSVNTNIYNYPILSMDKLEFLNTIQAIVGFRETERKNWNFLNTVTIDRMRETGFASSQTRLLPYIHVLDLSEDGYIKPHIDSSRVSCLFDSKTISQGRHFCFITGPFHSFLNTVIILLTNFSSVETQLRY